MAGQPDGATREEMRHYLNEDSGAPWGAPSPSPSPPRSRGTHGPGGAPALGAAPHPGRALHPAGVPPPGLAPPSPPPPLGAPPRSSAPPRRQGASSHHSPPANDGSDSDSEDRDNPHLPVRRCLDGGTRSTSQSAGSGTTEGAGGVVRKGNLMGGVGSGMGDGSGSEEGDTRGAQGDQDTAHVGTGRGGGSSSMVVTGAVGDPPAQPARRERSGARVTSCTPRRPLQPTCGRGWSGCSRARRHSAGPGMSGWSGGAVGCRGALGVVGGQALGF